ncbi:universal stress protein [Streptomyces sp. NPDC006463]|uniref:universal stress protein n=1 Tax=Streptomyces sp. NPDC006463 TaxID=3364746 RepID=UPI0036AA723F
MTAQVMVGVNGSPESLAAVAWAAHEAALRHVPLCLLHVEDWTASRETPGELAFAVASRSEALLRDALERACQGRPLLTVTTRCDLGPAAKTLRRAADEADLMVLGSRTLGEVAGFLLGSVSQAVAGKAGQPVVLVRADLTDASARGGIVAGIGLWDRSDPLLGFAFAEADRRGSELRVLHCWGPAPSYVSSGAMDPDEGLGQRTAERLAELLRPWRRTYPDVRVTPEAVFGSPVSRLSEAARGAGLLAVGRRRRKLPLGPHLGHVAHAVINHSTAPVAVVPLD